jgi:hypothetical protein
VRCTMPQLPDTQKYEDASPSWWQGKLPWLLVGFTFVGGLMLPRWHSGLTTTELIPVHGVVYFQDRPLSGGTIVFTPDTRRGQNGPIGMSAIDDQGFFRIASDGQPGVVPGYYAVTIAANSLPPRYQDPTESGQTAEIRADLRAPLEFHLK